MPGSEGNPTETETDGATATSVTDTSREMARLNMMPLTLTPPPPFLSTPGEPNIPWNTWIRMYDNYALMAQLANMDQATQKAYLINSLGVEGQRVFFNMQLDDDTCNAVRVAMNRYFMPTVNEVAERVKFRQHSQLANVSIEEYVNTLRDLVKNCNYGRYGEQCEPDMLRDQIIEKCYSPRLREKLLYVSAEKARENTLLTLDTTISIAKAMETVCRDTKTVTASSVETTVRAGQGSSDSAEVYAVSKRNQRQTQHEAGPGKTNFANKSQESDMVCYACSKAGHKANDPGCLARGKICRRCQLVGHFANSRKCKFTTARTNQIVYSDNEHTTESEEVDDLLYCFNVNSIGSNDDTIMMKGLVRVGNDDSNNVDIMFQVDTGARVSIIPFDVYKTYFSLVPLTEPRKRLADYSGGEISVLGLLKGCITVKSESCEAEFYVVKKGTPILGMDIIRKLSLLTPVHSVKSHVTKFVHKVKLKKDFTTYVSKRRPVPWMVRSKVSAELERLVADDIIERIDASEWVSPIVVVNKKDSEDIRLCVDLSQVNKSVVIDCYPLPRIEEVFNSLSGAKVFSTLDLKGAYHQVPLHEDSRDLTAFITDDGLFRYKRIPYGLASAPSFFQKMMTIVLKGQDGVKCYLDDILVYGCDKEEHDIRLKQVIRKLNDVMLRLNYQKCVIGKEKVNYLGAVLSADGIEPQQDKISAIAEMCPTTCGELRTFLGLIQYYHKYLPHLASQISPIRQALKADIDPLPMSHELKASINEVKQSLFCSKALAPFDIRLPTRVTTDASYKGLGAVLSQIHPCGSERVVAFASKSLSSAEEKYSVLELEALACIWAVERWHTYLWGRHFKLMTDHCPLTTIYGPSNKRASHRVSRWRTRLMVYSFEVEYKKGMSNTVADSLSRLPVPGETYEDDESEIIAQVVAGITDVSKDDFVSACQGDSTIQELQRMIRSNWKNQSTLDSFFVKLKDEFSIVGDIVLRSGKAVVPESYQRKLIEVAHESHQGIKRCKGWLRSMYWWKGMDQQVEDAVKNCSACAENVCLSRNAPLQPVPLPERGWQKVGIDITGPFAIAPSDCRFAVVLVDYRSKWPEVSFMKNVTSKNIIEWLEIVFAREGFPESLVSDNGSQFVSDEFESYLETRNIVHYKSSLYYPRANGEVERFNRTLKGVVKKTVAESKPWKQSVVQFLMAYRATPHSVTGVSPSVLLHGREMRTKLTLDRFLVVRPSTESVDEQVKVKQDKMKQYADSRRAPVDHNIQAGDMVRVKKQSRLKGQLEYSQPVVVAARCNNNTVELANGQRFNQCNLAPVPSSSSGIGTSLGDSSNASQALRPPSSRIRSKPKYLDAYVCG